MIKALVSAFGFIILMLAAVAFATPVPDTGQTKCYNATVEIACPLSGQPFYGQDAQYSINPMSYTKLDGSGNTLPDSAASWVMVKDNVTGLIWETKTVDGTIHDRNNTYTWYDSNPATNGGDAGAYNNGTNTENFIKSLNDAHYGGYSDWRMPTAKELVSIVNYNIPEPGPTIDTGYFLNTVSSFYWSSTTFAFSANHAWNLWFSHGYVASGFFLNNYKDGSYYIRAVRGGQPGHLVIGSFYDMDSGPINDATTSTDGYTDNSNGTVTDTSTGLLWQQVGSSSKMTWEVALTYCEGLNLAGYTDWRLPTNKELRSLVDYSRYNPAINTTYFPGTVSSYYWSSTTLASHTNGTWGVPFGYGDDISNGASNGLDKGASLYVRAVRGGQPGSLGNLVISPASSNVTKVAGTTTFSVSNTGTGTMAYTVALTPASSWLTIKSGSIGTNSGTINCGFTANTSTSARTGTIQVTALGATGSPKSVTVTQASTTPTPTPIPTPIPSGTPTPIPTPAPVLSLIPSNQSVTKVASTATFSVSNTGTGTMPWTATATSGSSWLMITSGASGTNSGTINCSFTANTTSSIRIATIRVTATGATGSPKDVTVTQAGTGSSILSPVPETGQTKCYNDTGNVITCPSSGQPFYGQDANYSINPMSYTKLDGSGNALPDSTTSWVMVKDNVTGLIWEMKTSKDGVQNYNDPHDADNRYPWYDSNPTTNGGDAGAYNSGTNAENFIKALNDAHYGGFSDWRMPTLKALASIVNYSIPYTVPTIDTGYFPNTVSFFYWSSTADAYHTNNAWGVYFYTGDDYVDGKDSSYYVRAVRGEQTQSAYTDNGDGTVTDTSTGLMWQKASSSGTWEQALTYCESLNLGGYTDWRMPTIKELHSIVDYSRYSPAINTTYFPNTVSSYYCSSTTDANCTARAWGVNFGDGHGKDDGKNTSYYVRAVRGGQPGIGSNSIDSMDVVKITDMSGLLPDGGRTVAVSAWDKDGKQLTAVGYALPLIVKNHGTTSIPGTDLEDRFPDGTPAAYTFSVESSKMFITNINNSSDGAVRVPIIYSNGLSNFVSNSIGTRNTLKVTDMSGTIASGGIAITFTAWDAIGNAIPESTSATPLKLYSHGTTSIDGSSLPSRFLSGTPMTYMFTIASSKLIVSNVKNSSDGTLNIPTVYTVGVSNFVSNSIGFRNTIYISDFSGTLDVGGAAINVRAWDVSGTEIPESESVSSYKIAKYETVRINGAELASRFSSGSPMTYEFIVDSSKVVITNVKSSSDGSINIPTVYTSGINNYTTNYVSDLNTIRITDMSGSIPSDGASITIVARDVDGNIIPESGSAIALKLNNYGTTTIEGDDLQNRFSGGTPVTYEFSIGSTSVVVTNLTKSSDGTINIPTVFTIGPYGGI